MAKYQGHKNWNHWNVSLWINNDIDLYSLAQEAIDYAKGRRAGRGSKEEAAQYFMEVLKSQAVNQTPDGAPYSISSIRAAMVGM